MKTNDAKRALQVLFKSITGLVFGVDFQALALPI
jgi:hypothetical protein